MRSERAVRDLRSRLAVLLAASHLLLFVVLPAAHLATAGAGHTLHDCPVCQILQRHDATDLNSGAPRLLAATVTRERVVLADLPVVTAHPGHATASRAPPLV
jgi:hypothetical protein